ncbi:Hypp789 [Branchiostoma lanceolatum]|uniref:Hypp789 protein n=1 Tax=Branchiostoma lanceolatum TaxID=7740 RepID=A0A8J9YLY7_BRALA|nr:Hypp789 [Branchiostoma lanceolatum]
MDAIPCYQGPFCERCNVERKGPGEVGPVSVVSVTYPLAWVFNTWPQRHPGCLCECGLGVGLASVTRCAAEVVVCLVCCVTHPLGVQHLPIEIPLGALNTDG